MALDPALESTFRVGQVVTYDGSTYLVISEPPAGAPDTSPNYILLAAAGETGATGAEPQEQQEQGLQVRQDRVRLSHLHQVLV
ncbi:hypothetical protein [Bacillus altitudinis]|uniref:hypothetical protein n=1 Tax=Bacillus altitudinis TaxID=293387 RepID=UPI003CF26E1D